MSRFFLGLIIAVSLCCAQNFPALTWVQEVDGSGLDRFTGIGTDAVGNTYIAGSTASPNFPVKNAVQTHLASPGYSNCFVTKLDPFGNVIYSTYFGGSGGDTPTAMTVDPAGNVYVTGTTGSTDFPTTKGAYSPSVPPPPPPAPTFLKATSFLFKLNTDGSVGYATYFSSSQTMPNAIAVDTTGSAWITGLTYGGLAITPGAYQTICACVPVEALFFQIGVTDAFLTRFDAAGSNLIFSTYLGVSNASGKALAVAPDGSAYLGSSTGIYRIDPAGSSLLTSVTGLVSAQAMAISPDGSLYVAGLPQGGAFPFQPTLGAFQPQLPATTPDTIAKMDAQLQHILAGTYFYGPDGNAIESLAVDAAGNVYAGGVTSLGLPTRTPLFGGFGAGFLSELSGDLSTLLFSSYFGADNYFGVQGVAVGVNGSIVIAGPETVGNSMDCASVCYNNAAAGNIWVNSLTLAPPPALRIDSIVNAASLIDGPISAGETIAVRGAGFGSDSQFLLGGVPVPAISISPTQIAATVPSSVPNGAAEALVESGGAVSNQVLVPVAAASPGVFSASGAGYGQGYILNQDGTLNTPSNPAAPGERITIYATGVGPTSFSDGYAVTQFPANVYIDGVYCPGVAAFLGPVSGFPGNVYRLSVYVPANITFPALDPLVLRLNGVSSQNGLSISTAP